MKQRLLKYAALVAVISLLTIACLSVPANAEEYNYVKNGLEALYIGNNNTGNGHDKNATVWKDLSGKGNDIDLSKLSAAEKEKVSFTDTGILNDSTKVYFPNEVKNVMNGDEFTVEISLGDVVSKGTTWNTFINSSNDSFSLFRLNANDQLVVKSETKPGLANERPMINNGLDLFKNSTITVTFKLGGKLTVYVDGEKVGEVNAVNKLNCDDFYFGHNGAERCHATEYRAIRFYSRELTADEVKSNYAVDKAVLGKANTDITSLPSTPAESASSETKIESSAAASSAPASTTSSQANSASGSKAATSSSAHADTEEESGSYYIYIIIAAVVVVAAVVVIVIINNKKDKTE